ncbi:MAG: hypothetical protein ACJAXS_000643 [Colwellia sp.]
MLFLKSLFCLTGSDNRSRFIAIHFSCYLLFAIFSAVFSFSSLLSFLVLSLFASICTLSTKRRLNDANLSIAWLLAPTGSFLIAGLIIIISDYTPSYWLLLLPLIISTLLMTYKSQKNSHILGYCGSVDLSGYVKKQGSFLNKQRIEPTFNQNGVDHSKVNTHQDTRQTFVDNAKVSAEAHKQSSDDFGEAIRLKLFNIKNKTLTLSILISLALVSIIFAAVSSLLNDEQRITPDKSDKTPSVGLKQTLLHKITLPDNFSLSVSAFDGITIKWQGTAIQDGFLWQQGTAQGDNTCQAITYDNGDMIRTLDVIQVDKGDNLASFSPLDTKVIVKNIAIRSSFILCGYTFSLKGSQSILGKHRYYSTYLEY